MDSDPGLSRHLQFYFHRAGNALGGELDKDFWLRLVPQLAGEEPAVRHCLMAISYLYEVNYDKASRDATYLLPPSHEDRAFVTTHYNKGIRALQSLMETNPDALETILATCVLFICLEYMDLEYGNSHTNSWFSHVASGVNLLRQVRAKRSERIREEAQLPTNAGPSIARTQTSIDILLGTLEPMFLRLGTYSRLQGHHVSFVGSQDAIWTLQIPSTFDDYAHARQSLNAIQGVSLPFIRLAAARNLQQQQLPILRVDTLAEATTDLGNAVDGRAHQRRLVTLFADWLDAFNKLDNNHANPLLNTRRWLRMVQKIGTIWVECITDLSSMRYDEFLPDMQEVVAHAEAVNASEKVRGNREFAFEMEVVAPLYFAALHCHHPPTRARAIVVLSQLMRREGTWFPRQLACILRRVAEIEESDLELRPDGEAWPTARIRIHDMYYRDRRDGRVLMTFHSQPNGPESKGLLWDEWIDIGGAGGPME